MLGKPGGPDVLTDDDGAFEVALGSGLDGEVPPAEIGRPPGHAGSLVHDARHGQAHRRRRLAAAQMAHDPPRLQE